MAGTVSGSVDNDLLFCVLPHGANRSAFSFSVLPILLRSLRVQLGHYFLGHIHLSHQSNATGMFCLAFSLDFD